MCVWQNLKLAITTGIDISYLNTLSQGLFNYTKINDLDLALVLIRLSILTNWQITCSRDKHITCSKEVIEAGKNYLHAQYTLFLRKKFSKETTLKGHMFRHMKNWFDSFIKPMWSLWGTFSKETSFEGHMGLAARKSVFGVSDKVRFKPACSAIETS